MNIRFVANDKSTPQGKLADAEVHFTEGPLKGLRLLGFAVWEARAGKGLNVTFPARTYSVNGERRSFSLLRPIQDQAAQEGIRTMIIQEFEEFRRQAAAS